MLLLLGSGVGLSLPPGPGLSASSVVKYRSPL